MSFFPVSLLTLVYAMACNHMPTIRQTGRETDIDIDRETETGKQTNSDIERIQFFIYIYSCMSFSPVSLLTLVYAMACNHMALV